MHVPLKLVIEKVDEVPCNKCGTRLFDVIRVNVFGQSGLAETPALCMDCIGDGFQVDIDIEEPEVEVSGKKKVFKKQKQLSRKQEVFLAEDLGGKVQLNSGATVGSKGDVRVKDEFRVEAKFTAADSYKLDINELAKIESECAGREKPLFIVDYIDKHTKKLRERYAVLPYDQLKETLDAARKNR